MNDLPKIIESSPSVTSGAATVPEMFRVGASLIHRRTRCVETARGKHWLRPKEFDLLILLYEHVTQTFSREELLQRVWHYQSDIVTRTVDQTVATLRKKIELGSDRPRFLQTVRGIGYRLAL